ncbi:MAG: pilus assembly protein PilM [Kofleriaceae bacterium]|nr:pilus assembly protein PilM [Kofleriaceae bacterium]
MSRIYALDLGAWSVKLAIAQPGLRGAQITHVVERLVPPGAEAAEARAWAVVRELVREHGLEHDTGYLGVFGGQVYTHVLEFAFKNLRRGDLDKAVGAELETVVPVDLEDMVYAFEPLPAAVPPPVPGDGVVRGRVAAPAEGMRVLTYAMRKDRAQELIASAQAVGVTARGLLSCGGAAIRLIERVPALAAAREAGPVAVVDIGHERTDVIVVRAGRAVYSRSLGRAGRQVTDAIARTWKLSFEDAERAKHSDGFVASAAQPAPSEAWARIHEAVVTEVAPMARELRQTFAGCRARTGDFVGAVLVVGGGSRLRGLASFLTEQLGVPVLTLTDADAAALTGGRIGEAAAVDAAAMTVAMAHDGASGRPLFDLRSGDLAAKVDLSFLRAKAVPLAAAALAIVVFALGSAWASFHRLRAAEQVLGKRLAVESRDLFDGEVKTAAEILSSSDEQVSQNSPMPKLSAYDVLLAINGKLPGKDKVTLNVSNLEIGFEKVTLRGTAKTPEEIDLIVTELKKIECFEEPQRGATENGPNGEKRFQLTIKANCM